MLLRFPDSLGFFGIVYHLEGAGVGGRGGGERRKLTMMT